MNIDEYRLIAQEEAQSAQEQQQDNSQPKGEETNAQANPAAAPHTEQTNQTQSQEGIVSDNAGAETAPPALPDTVEVNGQVVPIDELKNGYLRQSDYTQKTQQLAAEKQRAEVALQYFEAINQRPELAEKIAESFGLPYVDPATLEKEQLQMQYNDLLLQTEINNMQQKYEDFDAQGVLQYAYDNKLESLEDAYLLHKAKSGQPQAPVDVASLTEQIRQQVLADLQSNVDTQSIIQPGGGSAPVQSSTPTLSAEELKVAQHLRMTPEEYAKWSKH